MNFLHIRLIITNIKSGNVSILPTPVNTEPCNVYKKETKREKHKVIKIDLQ